MSKEEKIFFEIHKDIPREGPGSFESTKIAYTMLSNVPSNPVILDVGSGPGKQTFDLAEISQGRVIALDNHKPYLDKIEQKKKGSLFEEQISTKLGDMNDLPFAENEFDVIWAEGSVYLMGIGKAIELWKNYLKKKGYIVFSELCWFQYERPEEIEFFWQSNYGLMQTLDDIVKFLANSNYKFIGSYTLPDNDWWHDYYSPLTQRIGLLKEEYSDDKEALEVLKMELTETEMHEKYSKYYGYSFFVIQNVS